MTLYKCFDVAFPPQSAPDGAQAVLGYLGREGQTPHVWTMPEWDRFAHLRQYPAWVPDFGADPGAEAVQAVLAMLDHGWAPRQAETRAIVCDLETSVHPGWYQAWADRIGTEGFVSVAYGSLSTVLENAAAHTLELFPCLARVKVLRQWAGLCDMPPDFAPIIGPVDGVEGFILDVGWGTYGFKAGPAAGARVAELIATGQTPAVIRPFALSRFANLEPLGEKAAAAVSH